VAAACGVAAALALAALALRASRTEEAAFPRVDGVLAVRGLRAPAELLRDARGIPHVEALFAEDAWLGLGVAHAQDRLAQMEWLRSSARGTAAELAGDEALPADRLARTLGFARSADAAARELDRETRVALEAYAAGVNGVLEEIRAGRAGLPLALRDGGAIPEPWTPADSLAVVKLYAWGLGGTLDTSLVLFEVLGHLGGLDSHPFFPARTAGEPLEPETEARARSTRSRVAVVPADPLRRAIALDGPGIGSDAWVVSPEASASGLPLLASSAHHRTTAPALLYAAQVRAPDLDVAGATLPGAPVFYTGRTPRTVWASTNPALALSDLYVESLHPSNPRLHHDGDGFSPLRVRSETLRVRGGSEQVLEVRETRHGPLLNPLLEGEREPLALAWAGAQPGDGVRALLRVAQARSAAELRAALALHHEPALCFVFADDLGDGGLQIAGSVPRRHRPSGFVPVPARGGLFEWEGSVPFGLLPRARLGPGRPFVVAADAALESPSPGEVLEWLWRPGRRAERIAELLRGELRARGELGARALGHLQRDLRSERARAITAAALALAEGVAPLSGREAEAAALLREWNGDVAHDSAGAAMYHVFVLRLLHELFEPVLGAPLLERYLALSQVDPLAVLERVLADEDLQVTWLPAPAARGDAVRRSLGRAWLWLSANAGTGREKWSWGRLHDVGFEPFAPLGGAFFAGDRFAIGGDADTVAAAGYDASHPFAVRSAPTFRFVVDLAAPDTPLSSLVPGQSEHRGHPHALDGLLRWREGRLQVLPAGRILVEEEALARLQLEPAR
jgi:penicillin amidase